MFYEIKNKRIDESAHLTKPSHSSNRMGVAGQRQGHGNAEIQYTNALQQQQFEKSTKKKQDKHTGTNRAAIGLQDPAIVPPHRAPAGESRQVSAPQSGGRPQKQQQRATGAPDGALHSVNGYPLRSPPPES